MSFLSAYGGPFPRRKKCNVSLGFGLGPIPERCRVSAGDGVDNGFTGTGCVLMSHDSVEVVNKDGLIHANDVFVVHIRGLLLEIFAQYAIRQSISHCRALEDSQPPPYARGRKCDHPPGPGQTSK